MKKIALAGIDYADLLIAASLALLFSVLGALNKLEGDALVQANLALIGVIALGLFRERFLRLTAAAVTERSLAAVESDRPWQVLEEELEWDIADRDLATATATREIRFMQAESVSVYEFQSTSTDGKLLLHSCQGRRSRNDVFKSLPLMKEIIGPFGRSYTLISLEGIYRRGEHLQWVSVRKLQGYFPGTTENVSKAIQMPTDHLTMRVLWPPDRRPHAVRLERTGHNPIALPTRIRNGRSSATATISDANLGEVISITWDWG